MQTKLCKTSKTQNTLKVSVPKAVQEMMNLNAGEYLDWIPVVENGEIIFKVEKSKEKR